jgi:hypothetical protein
LLLHKREDCLLALSNLLAVKWQLSYWRYDATSNKKIPNEKIPNEKISKIEK